MGLRRLISDLRGKTIPQRIINKLNSSNELRYRGGRLSRRKEGGILWSASMGYERLYDSHGRILAEYFR